MDLQCKEQVPINDSYVNIDQSVIIHNCVKRAINDPVFVDQRCLDILLKLEEHSTNVTPYFDTVQKDITQDMRKVVAEWMMQVCEESQSQEEVFVLAVGYMDRFLETTCIKKSHLQILGAACLLIASKFREPSNQGLAAELLVYYTDNSITKLDLIQWELVVLCQLRWDVSIVTPLDFLELLLNRLPIENNKCIDISADKIRKHSQALIALAAREFEFTKYSASTIAGSSIAAALTGLQWHTKTDTKVAKLLGLLTDLTGVEQSIFQDCMDRMNDMLFEQICKHNNQVNPTHKNQTNNTKVVAPSEKGKVQAGTPTDVQDVEI